MFDQVNIKQRHNINNLAFFGNIETCTAMSHQYCILLYSTKSFMDFLLKHDLTLNRENCEMKNMQMHETLQAHEFKHSQCRIKLM